jgi:hypothetical protein
MKEQLNWFTGRREENFRFSLASDTEAYAGHLRNARQLTKQALEVAVRADSGESGALWLENAALREAAFGDRQDAKEQAEYGLKLYPKSREVQAEAALGFAMAGDAARAESLAQNLNKGFPVDTQMQFLWLPAIKAQMALIRTIQHSP